MIWNQAESAPREAIEATQVARLRETARRVYAISPFYKKKFDDLGINPEAIKSVEEVETALRQINAKVADQNIAIMHQAMEEIAK